MICAYGTRTDEGSIGVKVVKAVFMVIVSACFVLILLVIWGTNRFLTRFVFQKIEAPLEILAHGAEEIGTGEIWISVFNMGRTGSRTNLRQYAPLLMIWRGVSKIPWSGHAMRKKAGKNCWPAFPMICALC